MPLVLRQPIDDQGEWAVWKITETPERLLEELQKKGVYADIPFFRNPGRLSEWLTARLLLTELGIKQKIVYNAIGKPHLEGEGAFISISHSGDYVAVIVHPRQKVGIDVEKTGDRIHRVSHKFINEQERLWLDENLQTEQLYVIWGAKECAFKIYGWGGVDFREHLEVEAFDFKDHNTTRVHFKKGGNHCVYQVFFQYLNGVMVTYAMDS